jgi:hypothetical protein
MISVINKFIIALIFLFFIVQTANSKQELKGYNQIIDLMKSGQLSEAEEKLQIKLNEKGQSLKDRYNCQLLLNKIYLNKQEIGLYGNGIKKLRKAAKYLPSIYQAESFAHQAYYWHYYMWQDSALFYADKSMKIYQQNREKRYCIETAFVYEVYAITYLYRKGNACINAYNDLNLTIEKKLQFQYFDSAIHFMRMEPFTFQFDESMLYRSYANRWLDVVSWSHKDAEYNQNADRHLMWVSFSNANNLYDKALGCLEHWNYNDMLLVSALKGCIHTYAGRYVEARFFFRSQLKKIPKDFLYHRSKISYNPLITFLTFKVRNDIKLPFSESDFQKNVSIIKNLRTDFWNSFKNSDLPYDSYRTSPYINLFNLYTHASDFGKKDPILFKKGISYLLTVKSYYNFLNPTVTYNSNNLPFIDVSSIQRKLKVNECYLFLYDTNDLMEERKIMVTNKNVKIIKSSNKSFLDYKDLHSLKFKEFIYEAHNAYQAVFSSVMNVLPKVKKVYIEYDDHTHYDLFVKDTVCNDFSNTQFLGQQINFVKIYNPAIYFSGDSEVKNFKLDARMLRQNDQVNNELFFMPEFFRKFPLSKNVTNSFLNGHFTDELGKDGILHLYGHGELATNNEAYTRFFQITYNTKNSKIVLNKLNSRKKINRDLVVLNNCFSGYPFFNKNEFNKTIPLRLLSNGCNAVINSPGKVDDFYSAQFFKIFYSEIQKGIIFEDAFFNAKRIFFEEYPEHRHPDIWNALQLIQSKKMKIVKERDLSFYFLAGYLCLIIFDFLQSLLNAFWPRKRKVLDQIK